MRNIDKIRKLKAKQLSRLFNYQYTNACEMCGYEKICDACNNANGKPCDCEDGGAIWLKQKYNKKQKCWECIKNEQSGT